MKVIATIASLAALPGALAYAGDVNPRAMPVLNVSVEEGDYTLDAAQQAAEAAARASSLAGLRDIESSERASVANLLRGNAAKISKASLLAKSFLKTPVTSDSVVTEITSALNKDCGDACVKVFQGMLDTQMAKHVNGKTPQWESVLQSLMKDEATRTQSVLSQIRDEQNQVQSFVALRDKLYKQQSKATAGAWNPLDTPCFNDVSCKLVEVIGNKCNFGRVATLASYNAVNLATHVMSVVTSVLCGCFHVGPISRCVLDASQLPPVCGFFATGWGAMKSTSQSVWSAVKTATVNCRNIGHPLVAV